MSLSPLRVLVVDDSTLFRQSIVDVLSGHEDIEVVGTATQGELALQAALTLKPDAITLDLEMPRMDGYTFLRILMARLPTPVIVVSSHASRENIWRALEFGAIDFVVKPGPGRPADASLARDLLTKVRLARSLTRASLKFSATRNPSDPPLSPRAAPTSSRGQRPRYVVTVAASTGGPVALLAILSRLSLRWPGALCIAQHMPPAFTQSFAERLDRKSAVGVAELTTPVTLEAGRAYVCPGDRSMVVTGVAGGPLGLTHASSEGAAVVPSGDLLMRSAAEAMGARAVGVVLTGMGDDGLSGARAIRDHGGIVVCESEETAVVYGMPGAVVRAGLATHVLPLPEIATLIANLA